MIDKFLGIDTGGGLGGGGRGGGFGGGGEDTGHYGFCHRMRHAVIILFFFKGQVKSPILHNTRDGSEFNVPYLSHYL